MKWFGKRLSEPSTYGGLAGLCLVACFATFQFWEYWEYLGYAAGLFFVIQAIKSEQRGD